MFRCAALVPNVHSPLMGIIHVKNFFEIFPFDSVKKFLCSLEKKKKEKKRKTLMVSRLNVICDSLNVSKIESPG